MRGWTVTVGFGIASCLTSSLEAQFERPPASSLTNPPGIGAGMEQNRANPYAPFTVPTAPPDGAPLPPQGVKRSLSSAPASQNPRQVPLELFEPGKLVARVGDQPVFYGDLLGDLNQIVEKEMPEASATIKDLRRKELFEQLLPRLIEQKMIYADFLRNLPEPAALPDILERLDSAFYDSEVPKLIAKAEVNNLSELEQTMRLYGTSLRNIKRAWKESQIVSYYISEKFKEEKEVTHHEMLDYYRDHLDDYIVQGRVKYEQLMVDVDKFPNRAAARQAIAEMGNEVVFGAPLDAVAKRRSHGPLAVLGGQHDWTLAAEIAEPEVAKALFELPPNYLSDIIETQSGYYILRVLDREEQETKAFRNVQKEIKEALQQAARQEKIEAFLSGLKENIPVWTILDEEQENSSMTGALGSFPLR